jgi:hypothetical protein
VAEIGYRIFQGLSKLLRKDPVSFAHSQNLICSKDIEMGKSERLDERESRDGSRASSSVQSGSSSPATATSERHDLFSSLFFGNAARETMGTFATASDVQKNSNGSSKEVPETTGPILVSDQQLDGVISQVERLVPHDPIALRQAPLYKGALQLLQYQRDNYLVGTEYADWRKRDRQRQENQPFYTPASILRRSSILTDLWDIPYDATALGHGHVANLASGFIPTSTLRNVLVPVLIDLVQPTCPLYQLIQETTSNVIVGQQSNLEQTIKNQMLQFLNNPKNREAIKSSTKGMLIRTTMTPTEREETAAQTNS